jgi:hypothetical protein
MHGFRYGSLGGDQRDSQHCGGPQPCEKLRQHLGDDPRPVFFVAPNLAVKINPFKLLGWTRAALGV